MDENRKSYQEVNAVFAATLFSYLAAGEILAVVECSLTVQLLVSQLAILLPSLIYMLLRKRPLTRFLRFKRIGVIDFFLIVLFGICLQPVLSFINGVSMLFTEYSISSTISENTKSIPFLVMFLSIACLPAFCEEFVYRGLYFHTYRKESIAKGALLSGLLFGMMHGNFNQFAYAFVLGVVFALLVEATGTMFSSMLLHFGFNGFSVCLLYLLGYLQKHFADNEQVMKLIGDTAKQVDSVLTPQVVFMALLPPAIICGTLAFFLFRTIAIRNHTYTQIKNSFRNFFTEGSLKRLVSIPLIISLLILFGLMLLVEMI